MVNKDSGDGKELSEVYSDFREIGTSEEIDSDNE